MDDRIERKLEALRNILRLERENGYPDRAVMGGLDRFLERWVEDPEVRLRLTNAQVPIPTYGSLTEQERARWAETALRRLEEPATQQRPERPPATGKPASRRSSKSPAPRAPARGQRRSAKEAGESSAVRRPGSLEDPLPIMRGVASDVFKKLARLNVRTHRDALFFFPHRHNDFSQRATIAELVAGIEQTLHVTVAQAQERQMGRRMKATEAVVTDETGSLRVVWFNQPYLARTFKAGTKLALSGRVGLFRGRPVMENPEYEALTGRETIHAGRLVPVYPLTEGLSPRTVRRVIKAALDAGLPLLPEIMPSAVLERTGLMDRQTAITQSHYPDTEERREQARRRLAFDELLLLQIGVLVRRRQWREEQEGLPMQADRPILERFLGLLPFSLTGAQDRVLREVLEDMTRPKPMSRLVQGEVGSGKTVVAVAAMLVAVANGYQAAMMAPTEVLAEQHYQTVTRILDQASEGTTDQQASFRGFKGLLDRPLRVARVLGRQSRGERRALHQLVRRGDVDIVIGTHTLIQEDVAFANLGLVVVDEQHRFGVEQRGQLRQKGQNPHLLVMTATPIPRTLALTLYGDLDVSMIDELPPGRQEIKTRSLPPEDRDRAYRFIRRQVEEGRQAFVICPLVEESENFEARAAVVEYERLSQEVYPDLRVGLLHGRMRPQEKDEVMSKFRDGELEVLVSTPVVEVGVDVPNATVMLVEGAERFGLAQLHQFRGRVGRGEHQSYCMFLSDSDSDEVKERLRLLQETRNGLELAEADLRMRGPGEFFGTRQSGVFDLKMARLSDVALLETAREEAVRLFREDPYLEAQEHAALRQAEAEFWQHVEEAPGGAAE